MIREAWGWFKWGIVGCLLFGGIEIGIYQFVTPTPWLADVIAVVAPCA
jgi:hypothetical protein